MFVSLFFQLGQMRAEVILFETSFFKKKVCCNKRSLFDPSWMMTDALIVRVVLLILILSKCLLQHIQQQWKATEVTLWVLMALGHPSFSPSQEVMMPGYLKWVCFTTFDLTSPCYWLNAFLPSILSKPLGPSNKRFVLKRSGICHCHW